MFEFRIVLIRQLDGLKSCSRLSGNKSVKCWTCTDKKWKIANTTPEKHMEDNDIYRNANIDGLLQKTPLFFWDRLAGDTYSKGDNFSLFSVTEEDSAEYCL